METAIGYICNRLQQMCVFRTYFRECFIVNIIRSLNVEQTEITFIVYY